MNSKLLLLKLLDADDGDEIEGITRFQKLIFLLQEEVLDGHEYEYKADDYGPFSKGLYDDIDALVSRGFIDVSTERTAVGNKKKVYQLSEKGKKAVNSAKDEDRLEVPDELDDFKSEYNTMGLWDLLEDVYKDYPDMAENSKLNI